MTRPMLLTLASGAVLLVACLVVIGFPGLGLRSAVMAIGVVGALPVALAFASAQKLTDAERDVTDQQRAIDDASKGIEDLRATVERQLGAIEETAASLHEMTAS